MSSEYSKMQVSWNSNKLSFEMWESSLKSRVPTYFWAEVYLARLRNVKSVIWLFFKGGGRTWGDNTRTCCKACHQTRRPSPECCCKHKEVSRYDAEDLRGIYRLYRYFQVVYTWHVIYNERHGCSFSLIWYRDGTVARGSQDFRACTGPSHLKCSYMYI